MKTKAPSRPGFCLVAEVAAGAAFLARVGRALEAIEAATLILVAADGAPVNAEAARGLVQLAQGKRVAALLADDVATARALGADGVHLSWRPEIEDAYEAARSALGPEAIVGVDAGLSRHDAMMLGEIGADYVAFGRDPQVHGSGAAPEEIREEQHTLLTWWAEIFVIPVVAFGAATPEDVSELAATGSDFIAVRMPAAATPDADDAWTASLRAALTPSAHTS
jgi:thiamine-phosphate pyrophosphorylase